MTERTEYGEAPDEAWDITQCDPEVELRTCEQCQEVRPCVVAVDPYLADVYDEITHPEWWCGTCFHQRADQI